MRRREFIGLLGGAAASWPRGVGAQQQPMPLIGFLRSTSLTNAAHLVTAFHRGLKESGYIDGRNITVELHSAEGSPDRLASLVADLIRRPVALIVANTIAAVAAKAATQTIPILFATGSDPVRDGLVASLNRPAGNLTGAVFFASVLGGKRLEQLRQLVPNATTVALLVNPNTAETEAERNDVQAAALAVGQQLVIVDVSSERDIETAFATFVQRGAGALLVGSGTFTFSRREPIIALAARHRLPASFTNREAVLGGGLLSYAASQTDAYRQLGIYAGRVLKGEKAADLPVWRVRKFELVLNLKTAKTLDIEIPPTLLAVADEVIE
jgi:putative ABC transport system substrate-binding protein